ncbi:energy-coupling factor transport system permease protein [Salsuginibacillus halophilus]|uniref:Energy-coupling factor transport system permease protein n=1 Tax=Salsuginibacillus halophilus TaxID=517424 RepID=A0A2P8HKX0_9BACI|nr:energy-coupling factor transporter transmembrane component T [Salsuginibacillus halophilus]PSL46859.1 energy-coupling factor transport system permease protein [Salsuginibacillus halophilus]
MGSVLIGQYIRGSSVIHLLDPRAKLISIFVLMFAILWIDTALGYAAAAVVTAAMLYIARIPFKTFLRSLRPMIIILSFLALAHAIVTPGTTPLFSFGWLSVYPEGIINAVEMVVRIILLVTIASILTLTTKPLEVTQGLEQLLSPLQRFKLPIEQFAFMASLTLRFIPTLLLEAEKIMEAQKARGVSFQQKNPWKRLKSYIPIMLPLLTSAVQRAGRLTDALEARGYQPGAKRTRSRQFVYKQLDYGAFTIFGAVSAMLVLL